MGRISHPSHVFLFTLINTSFVSNQKQKKKLFDKFFLLVFKLSRLLIHVFMTFLMKLVLLKKLLFIKYQKLFFAKILVLLKKKLFFIKYQKLIFTKISRYFGCLEFQMIMCLI